MFSSNYYHCITHVSVGHDESNNKSLPEITTGAKADEEIFNHFSDFEDSSNDEHGNV